MIYAEDTVDAPEAALAATEHSLGESHASVTLLEYGDYECPACIRAEPLVRGLIATTGPRLRFVFRHYPLVELHAHAELAAEAAEAAAAQGQFWPMHQLLFSQIHKLTLPDLAAYAESIELDMIRFNGEMADRIYTQRVQEHRRAGEQSGLQTTPAFFLDGKLIDVSDGFGKLEDAVRAALAGK
ncbi:DsbA family protein [Uliginosibacterium flavum]|uniref:Thioredoxin domain-containing protein n=1 Tax=Uliginosibacterium flavum TaxID=1396831 RepID=A0ABV2TG50_9RHOO